MGNTTPKRAETVGSIILFGVESSPTVVSLLMSIATWKKKIVINVSLIKWVMVCGR